MAEGGGGVVRMRGWRGVWSFLACGEWLVVLWLTLAWTVFSRRVLGRGGGSWYTGRVRGGMWTEVLNAPCETEKELRGSEGCAQSIGSQRERIRTQPVMCLVDSLVQVLYAFLQGKAKHGPVLGASGTQDWLGEAGP